MGRVFDPSTHHDSGAIMMEFWFDSSQWPRDPSGFVFLARAVHEIGRTIMKDEWTGSEPTTEFTPHLPFFARFTNSIGSERANSLLMKYRPLLNHTPIKWAKWGPHPMTFSVEEWNAAVELSKDVLPYVLRFLAVQSEIVQQCEAGDLASFYRWDTTGQMLPIPREWWNTDRWQPRFAMCRINPRDPMSIGIAGDNFCWIFLQRSSLDLFLASRRSDSVQVESNISAQTKCMKWLCEQMQLNEKPIKLKAEYWEEAKDRFRVGRNAFDRAWGDAVQQTGRAAYSARGRRPARNG